MHRHRSRLVAATAVVAFAILAAACSSSGSGSDSTSATSTSAGGSSSTSSSKRTTTTAPSTTSTTTPRPTGYDPSTITVKAAVATTTSSTDGSLATPDGRTRTFHVFVPTGLDAAPDATPVPLLVAMHGGTGWGKQYEKNSGFDGLAQANGFIVVYPDGIGIGADGTSTRTWNGGKCCGPAVRAEVDDVAFIGLLIDQLERQYAIDPARVFAAGHSNGGILAYRLACELSDRIAAIGVQSSAMEISTCDPAQPVSALHIHGSGDQNLPIDGGKGPNAASGVDFEKPIDGATTLAKVDGCPTEPLTATDAANPDLSTRTWTPCDDGTTVAFLEVAGASHAWMGSTGGGSTRSGPVYSKLDSSLQIWNFLSQHPRP